uniref:Uncharacterized protein n=1 Tax=Brassica oleracea TaxID=3712 RepID=A0A3P6DXQ4_BRAOL|nr:unnamed protein product [Brassica oleracea]
MCIVGNKKKGNRSLKEIGTFMMTTCFIANYQSVLVCQNNQHPYFSDVMGDGNMNSVPSYASASSFDALFPPCAKLPFHGVELQPSSVSPKNFVVFDQTYDRSQVMYHPELTLRLVNSGLASSFQNEYVVGGYDEDEEDDESEDGGDSEEVNSTTGDFRINHYFN